MFAVSDLPKHQGDTNQWLIKVAETLNNHEKAGWDIRQVTTIGNNPIVILHRD